MAAPMRNHMPYRYPPHNYNNYNGNGQSSYTWRPPHVNRPNEMFYGNTNRDLRVPGYNTPQPPQLSPCSFRSPPFNSRVPHPRPRAFHHNTGPRRFPGHVPRYDNHNRRFREHGMIEPNYQNNKKKIDKRDLPENNKFVCEMCDRGFPTNVKYEVHVAEHIKCKIDGCNYEAAPKLVKLHLEWQHKTGYAKKIWQLESREDINKWIAERKKNFPTAENVKRKKEEREAKIARGEVLETKEFGKMRRGRGGRHRGRGRGSNHVAEETQKRNPPETIDNKSGSAVSQCQDPLSLVLNQNDDSSGKVDMNSSSGHNVLELLADYGASSGEEEGEIQTEDGPIEKTAKSPVVKNDMNDVKCLTSKSTTSSTNAKSNPTDDHTSQRGQTKNSKKRKKQESWTDRRPPIKRHKATLLEKLLANDIRHERNVLLQCIRHIVSQDFLGVGNKLSCDLQNKICHVQQSHGIDNNSCNTRS